MWVKVKVLFDKPLLTLDSKQCAKSVCVGGGGGVRGLEIAVHQ